MKMKTITIECEVGDFCPEDCTAIDPAHFVRDGRTRCLRVEQCWNLRRALERTAEIYRELDAILERHEQAALAAAEVEAEADGES